MESRAGKAQRYEKLTMEKQRVLRNLWKWWEVSRERRMVVGGWWGVQLQYFIHAFFYVRNGETEPTSFGVGVEEAQ